LSREETRALAYWEKYLPGTVKLLKAQGPLALPNAIRRASHWTRYAEELALFENQRLSRQQARSMFQLHR
jgi:hypothetical protein